MASLVQYYLGRVIKGGRLGDAELTQALENPRSVTAREYSWIILDYEAGRFRAGRTRVPFLSGRLAKYKPDAMVRVVDARTKRLVAKPEPNLESASSRFVILPTESLIAYRHIWNEISESDFRRRFAEIVEASLDNYFVSCEIVPLTDERAFAEKLASLSVVEEIKATVVPPNPLFGPLWRSLREYLRRRDADRLHIKESGSKLQTDLQELARETVNEGQKLLAPAKPPELADAAVLMASDGYGRAQVTGTLDATRVVIRTTDVVERFRFEPDPKPIDLAKHVWKYAKAMNRRRGLKH